MSSQVTNTDRTNTDANTMILQDMLNDVNNTVSNAFHDREFQIIFNTKVKFQMGTFYQSF